MRGNSPITGVLLTEPLWTDIEELLTRTLENLGCCNLLLKPAERKQKLGDMLTA